jgi:hypothetical protein
MAIWCHPNTLGKFSSALQTLLDLLLWVWTPLPKKLIHNTGTLVYNVECNLKFEHIFSSLFKSQPHFFPTPMHNKQYILA